MENKIVQFYRKYYDLERIDLKICDSSIAFLIYDNFNYYYLDNNKFLETNENINILDITKKLNQEYNLEISNYYPVCFCKETLIMAFSTRKTISSLLKRILVDDIDEKYRKLIEYHQTKYKTLFLSKNVKEEINRSQKYINRYKIHENFIKKYILTEEKRRKKEFANLIKTLIPDNKESIIDVSCGDNEDIFKLAQKKNYKDIVGNDICINYFNDSKNVIFTNDDVEQNEIRKNAYDVAYCKNTLHHMNNISNIRNMLTFLNNISKEIVIVEICNPKEKKGLPRFLNKYLYNWFLKDAGSCYLNQEEFSNIINSVFNKEKIEYFGFKNILGTYMIARIRRNRYED